MSVSSTARDTFQLDFLTVTLADCTATSTLAQHNASLATIADAFGRVCRADEVLEAWQTPGVRAEFGVEGPTRTASRVIGIPISGCDRTQLEGNLADLKAALGEPDGCLLPLRRSRQY